MKIPATVLAIVTVLAVFAAAQAITVDDSHSTNHLVPSETHGAGVDRIPSAATAKDLLSTSPEATLFSGWQTDLLAVSVVVNPWNRRRALKHGRGARATRPGTWILNIVYLQCDQRKGAWRLLLLYCC
ncbi:MAG: hypothetical protein LAO30_21730 [Acidobacteriia bacterium]|nr:hypothetical protein [Terriglobia bacterium]